MSAQYMTIKQLSEYMNIPVWTLYAWVHQKRIPYYKIGKMIRFDVYEVTQWLTVFRIPEKADKSENLS